MLSKLLVFSLLYVPGAFACSCVTTGSYCNSLHETKIVFVGRVIEDSGEQLGMGPAKMIVEEVLHGLPKATRELIVDTGAGTSCYMRLQKDERYVIYGRSVPGVPNRVSRDWCSFSFNVAGNRVLLSALRQAEIKGRTHLVGKVQMKYEKYNTSGEPATRVPVVASSGDARLERITNQDGEFDFSDVPAGQYHLEIVSPNLVEDEWRWPAEDPHVAAGSCGYQNLYVWPNGSIEGRLQTTEGKSIEGVTVQAFARANHGELDTKPLRESKTDSDGKYSLSGLPPGQFVVAVNGEKYNDRLPWPPTFYRNTSDREHADWLHLERGQKLSGIDLQLPPPRVPAFLHIEAVFEDGSPALDAGANVENLLGEQRAFALGSDKHTNVLDVPVYFGETYRVRSFLHRVKVRDPVQVGQPIRMQSTSWVALSEPIRVTTPDVRVRVVLYPDKK